MARILYGKPVADKIDEDTASFDTTPKIAVLLPDEPSSESYKKALVSKAEKLGIKVVQEPAEADGVIGKIDDPAKDVDCQTEENLGKLFSGKPLFKPATAQAVVELLKYYDIEIATKSVVVIGRSTIVGKPLTHLLLEEDATVTVCHSKTPDIDKFTKEADIIVSAAGKPNLITADMVSAKSVVIDVGTNFVDGRMVGDVDFDNVEKIVSAISPVPGGIGQVTTSILLRQVVEASKLNK